MTKTYKKKFDIKSCESNYLQSLLNYWLKRSLNCEEIPSTLIPVLRTMPGNPFRIIIH